MALYKSTDFTGKQTRILGVSAADCYSNAAQCVNFAAVYPITDKAKKLKGQGLEVKIAFFDGTPKIIQAITLAMQAQEISANDISPIDFNTLQKNQFQHLELIEIIQNPSLNPPTKQTALRYLRQPLLPGTPGDDQFRQRFQTVSWELDDILQLGAYINEWLPSIKDEATRNGAILNLLAIIMGDGSAAAQLTFGQKFLAYLCQITPDTKSCPVISCLQWLQQTKATDHPAGSIAAQLCKFLQDEDRQNYIENLQTFLCELQSIYHVNSVYELLQRLPNLDVPSTLAMAQQELNFLCFINTPKISGIDSIIPSSLTKALNARHKQVLEQALKFLDLANSEDILTALHLYIISPTELLKREIEQQQSSSDNIFTAANFSALVTRILQNTKSDVHNTSEYLIELMHKISDAVAYTQLNLRNQIIGTIVQTLKTLSQTEASPMQETAALTLATLQTIDTNIPYGATYQHTPIVEIGKIPNVSLQCQEIMRKLKESSSIDAFYLKFNKIYQNPGNLKELQKLSPSDITALTNLVFGSIRNFGDIKNCLSILLTLLPENALLQTEFSDLAKFIETTEATATGVLAWQHQLAMIINNARSKVPTLIANTEKLLASLNDIVNHTASNLQQLKSCLKQINQTGGVLSKGQQSALQDLQTRAEKIFPLVNLTLLSNTFIFNLTYCDNAEAATALLKSFNGTLYSSYITDEYRQSLLISLIKNISTNRLIDDDVKKKILPILLSQVSTHETNVELFNICSAPIIYQNSKSLPKKLHDYCDLHTEIQKQNSVSKNMMLGSLYTKLHHELSAEMEKINSRCGRSASDWENFNTPYTRFSLLNMVLEAQNDTSVNVDQYLSQNLSQIQQNRAAILQKLNLFQTAPLNPANQLTGDDINLLYLVPIETTHGLLTDLLRNCAKSTDGKGGGYVPHVQNLLIAILPQLIAHSEQFIDIIFQLVTTPTLQPLYAQITLALPHTVNDSSNWLLQIIKNPNITPDNALMITKFVGNHSKLFQVWQETSEGQKALQQIQDHVYTLILCKIRTTLSLPIDADISHALAAATIAKPKILRQAVATLRESINEQQQILSLNPSPLVLYGCRMRASMWHTSSEPTEPTKIETLAYIFEQLQNAAEAAQIAKTTQKP